MDTQEISLILDGNNQGTVQFSLTFLQLFKAVEWILTINNVRGNVSYVNCFFAQDVSRILLIRIILSVSCDSPCCGIYSEGNN